MHPSRTLWSSLKGSLRDLLPVMAVVALFQLLILRQPLPVGLSLAELGIGLLLMTVGLALFISGLQMGLFPMGQSLGRALVSRGSAALLLGFGFALGFGATFAEPTLLVVAGKAALALAETGFIDDAPAAIAGHRLALRLCAALGVGCAAVLAICRLLKAWPLPPLLIGLYAGTLLLSLIAPADLVGMAFDFGGVSVSAIVVPLLTVLGISLASTLHGRHPLFDGFGFIALASIMPVLFVLGYGLLQWS